MHHDFETFKSKSRRRARLQMNWPVVGWTIAVLVVLGAIELVILHNLPTWLSF